MLAFEYPVSTNEYSLGEEVDELLENELNVRMYSRYIELANLQVKGRSIALMQERMQALRERSSRQNREFQKLRTLNSVQAAKEAEFRGFVRNYK